MPNRYYEKDGNLELLKDRKVAITGYGSQGHAHALNLRDSGVDVIVGLYPGSKSWAKAEASGLRVANAGDAAKEADVVMILVHDHLQAALQHPIDASQTRIERAMLDVASHLLSANQHALDLRIIGRCKIGTRADVNLQASTRQHGQRGLLQAAFGDAQSKRHCVPPTDATTERLVVKQLRVPVWQTRPSPSTSTPIRPLATDLTPV